MSSQQPSVRPYINRLIIVTVLSTIFVALFNEGTYLLQKNRYDRAPETIQLLIPEGTAEKVESGESVPSIPAEMVFVIGDVLEVKNEDNVNHQLGPIWVPPGATGKLVMERAENLAYSCSFQTTRYLNLDVREPTTLGTRLVGLAISAPTMAVLLFIFQIMHAHVGQQTQ